MKSLQNLFLISLLILSSFPIYTFIHSTQSRDSFNQEHRLFDKNTNVVVFGSTNQEFSELLDYNPIKVYPNLRAVKISSKSYSTIDSYLSVLPAYPASSYFKAELIPTLTSDVKPSLETDRDILGVSELWDQGYNGTNIVVGIIDNGVKFTHPDLADREFISKNFTVDDIPINYDHGTLVAGAIVASGENSIEGEQIGTAIGAKIASANMGQTSEGFLVGDFLEAFDWLANITEVKIINTSWSGGGENIWLPVVQRLEQLDIIVVGSAGNSGSGYFQTKGSPANTVHGISVASSTYNLGLSSFSSEGPIGGGFAKPDVIAPGQGVFTTTKDGGYASVSGTSLSSPLVSGAVASLLSGIVSENIDWNVGLLKAAILQTTYNPLNLSESRAGQGFVNASSALDLIRSRNIDSWVPQISYTTPTTGFFEYLTKLRQDITSQIPFTLISSNVSRITIELLGNITNILSLTSLNQSQFSQAVFLNVNTIGDDMGNYSGSILVNDSIEVLSIPISLTVDSAPIYKVLFDLYHTTTDNGYSNYRAGLQTGALINLMNDKGIWVDMVDLPFNDQLLVLYDMVWMADPFDFNHYQELAMTTQELASLEYFLSRGGRLFLHYFGLFTDPYPIDGEEIVGNDPEQINSVLSLFGMSMYEVSPSILDFFNSEDRGIKEKVENSTILGSGDLLISTVDANPILFKNPSTSIVDSDQIVTYNGIEYGRVLISSMNHWFKSEDAINDPSSDDYQFMENMVDWFFNEPRVEFISSENTDTNVTLKFGLINNDEEVTPNAIRIGNQFFGPENYNITHTGSDIYSLTAPYDSDGDYIIEISAANDYFRWENRRDTEPPLIVSRQDKTAYDPGEYFVLEFNISDNLDVIDKTKINATLNGEFHQDFYFTMGVYYVEINGSIIPEGSYELNITVVDASQNVGNLLFKFRIGTDDGLSTLQIIAIVIGIGGVVAALVIGKREYAKRKAMTQTSSS